MATDSAFGGRMGSRCENNAALQAFLLERYALDSSSAFADLGGGNNLNLSVQKNGIPCVARVYRPWVSPERIEGIHRVIEILAGELPVPRKLHTVDGMEFCLWGERVVELEIYVPHDGQMNTMPALNRGLPALGRIHSLLHRRILPPAAGLTTFTNSIDEEECLQLTKRACARIRGWASLTDGERAMADDAEQLAERIDRHRFHLPRQITHGDFWDNNVLFLGDKIVWIGDFDYLGLRPRTDDLALTLYFTDAEFALFQPYAGDRFAAYRALFSRYQSGLDEPFSQAERMAMPYAMARQPLWGMGKWVAHLDDEADARRYLSDMGWYLKWGLSMLDTADQWMERVF